jgi:hypothetical protein
MLHIENKSIKQVVGEADRRTWIKNVSSEQEGEVRPHEVVRKEKGSSLAPV